MLGSLVLLSCLSLIAGQVPAPTFAPLQIVRAPLTTTSARIPAPTSARFFAPTPALLPSGLAPATRTLASPVILSNPVASGSVSSSQVLPTQPQGQTLFTPTFSTLSTLPPTPFTPLPTFTPLPATTTPGPIISTNPVLSNVIVPSMSALTAMATYGPKQIVPSIAPVLPSTTSVSFTVPSTDTPKAPPGRVISKSRLPEVISKSGGTITIGCTTATATGGRVLSQSRTPDVVESSDGLIMIACTKPAVTPAPVVVPPIRVTPAPAPAPVVKPPVVKPSRPSPIAGCHFNKKLEWWRCRYPVRNSGGEDSLDPFLALAYLKLARGSREG